jgi:hypothetical protein
VAAPSLSYPAPPPHLRYLALKWKQGDVEASMKQKVEQLLRALEDKEEELSQLVVRILLLISHAKALWEENCSSKRCAPSHSLHTRMLMVNGADDDGDARSHTPMHGTYAAHVFACSDLERADARYEEAQVYFLRLEGVVRQIRIRFDLIRRLQLTSTERLGIVALGGYRRYACSCFASRVHRCRCTHANGSIALLQFVACHGGAAARGLRAPRRLPGRHSCACDRGAHTPITGRVLRHSRGVSSR